MSQENTIDQSKRGFFRRLSSQQKRPPFTQQRLPWVESESAFLSKCTRCEKCLPACEENIIIKGDGGFPIVDFTKGECSFCEGCARACPEGVFDLTITPAFSHLITINEHCLAKKSVECRSCSDMCETQAIRFQLQLGSVAQPNINFDACNGCGGCVAVCPTSAISMTREDDASC